MSEPTAPPPAAPPPESRPAAAPPTHTRTRTRRGIPPLLLTAIIGSIVVIAATFAPWVTSEVVDDTQSGWELYDNQGDNKVNGGFYADDSFAEDAPFFTGLSTLIAGAAVLLVALALLASARGGGGPSDNLRGVLAFLGITAGVLMLIVCGTNLVSYLRKDDAVPVDIDWGLIVVWIGALASAAIIPAAFNQGSGDRV